MPAYNASSAMTRSRMPQRTKFAYTRLPISVTHQPVPANARIALKTWKPATMNMMMAAKVTIPGLWIAPLVPTLFSIGLPIPPGMGSLCCAILAPLALYLVPWGLRCVDGSLHLPGVRSDLFLHLLLGAARRLVDRALDRRLSNDYQGGLAVLEHLPDLLEVRVGHPAPEVAYEGARPGTHQPADQERRREDHTDRSADRQTSPAAVLGRLLGLVYYLDFALARLREDRGVVGAHDVLAVELL